jgi:hypothetical protein
MLSAPTIIFDCEYIFVELDRKKIIPNNINFVRALLEFIVLLKITFNIFIDSNVKNLLPMRKIIMINLYLQT